VFGWLSPRLLASSSVAPCFDAVEVLQTAQGAIFRIADAVKIIVENRADIDQWFPKGSRTLRVGAAGEGNVSSFLSPFVQTGRHFWEGPASGRRFYFESCRWSPELFFPENFPMTRFEAAAQRAMA
jgi:hypothetical protein